MATPEVFPLAGVLRRYEWGSPTAIPDLLGEPPDGRPAAELWFGAHAGDPSPALGATLDKLVDDDPVTLLGSNCVDRARGDGIDPGLPFLVKLLAAARALSIQVHPSRAQAREGCARERAAGVPLDSPRRVFKDANHKPELLCALSPFAALCGFRPVARTLALLDDLAWPEFDGVRRQLQRPDPLRAAVTALLREPDPDLARALTRRLAEPKAASQDPGLGGVALAAEHFPDDPGLPIALLLNFVVLEPGQALFLPAGNVHAYLRGLGVEVMANSDNVLRCGLTPKHVDAEALLAITEFVELVDPVVEPVALSGLAAEPAGHGAEIVEYPVPVRDFRPLRVTIAGHGSVAVPGIDEPAIVLCTHGGMTVLAGDAGVDLAPGAAAYVRPGARALRLRGSGEAFVVTCRSA